MFYKFKKGKSLLSVPNGVGDGSAYFYDNKTVLANNLPLPYGSEPRTVSLWCRVTDFNTSDSAGDIWLFTYGADGVNKWYAIGLENKRLYLPIYGGYHLTSYELSALQWYHIVFTFDGNETHNVYVNGTLVETFILGNLNTTAKDDYICVGCNFRDSGYFHGNLKELNVYNRVLSADEVTALYNKQEIIDGRVLHIPLQYGKDNDSIFSSKSFVYDYSLIETSSGFNALGKPIGYRSASGAGIKYSPMLVKDGLVFYAPLQKDIAPIIGNAPSLTGNATFGEVNGIECLQCKGNTRIDYPQTADLPTGNAPRTMSAWLSTTNPNGNGWNFACGFGGDDSYTMAYCFYSRALRLYRQDMNDSYSFAKNYPNDNTWVHCLTTFDGTTVKTYANGVLTFYFNVSYATSNRSVYLGYLGTQNAFNYYGNITSFRIYNRALTENEIQILANEFK